MSQRLVDFLALRPARERVLIGVLVLAVIPLAVVFGLLLPLKDGFERAQSGRQDAQALQATR